MAVVSEYGITNIIIMRCLNVVKENDIFELYRVSYNAVCSDKS